MGHRGRVTDEALDPAERFGERKVPEFVDECAHRRFAAVDFEADHAAEATLLTTCNGMSRMGLQSGIVDASHAVPLVQQTREQARRLLVLAHPHLQCAQASQGQETVERCAGGADTVRPPGQFFGQFRGRGNDGATHHVTVAVDVLGGGMHDDVRAERDGLLQCRREKRVVDRVQCAAVPGKRRDLRDVDNSEQRVRRCLGQDQSRTARTGTGECRIVGLVDEQHLEVALAAERLVESVGAAVTVVRHDQQVAWMQ